MLESLEQSNIKRMSVESPKEEFHFDPEKKFTPQMWREIEDQLVNYIKESQWDKNSVNISPANIIERIHLAKELGHDYRHLIPLINQKFLTRIGFPEGLGGRDKTRTLNNYINFIELYPDTRSDDFEDKYDSAELNNRAGSIRKQGSWLSLLVLAYNASRLGPDRLKLSDTDFEQIELSIQRESIGWHGLELAGMAKKMNPNSKIFETYLSDENREAVYDELDSRDFRNIGYLRASYWYKEISPQIPSTDNTEEEEPIPEQKNF